MVTAPGNSESTHTLRLRADASSMARGIKAVDDQLAKVTRQLDREQAMARKTAVAQAELAKTTKQLEADKKRLAQVSDRLVRQEQREAAEKERLRMKYDDVYRASKQYENVQNEIRRAFQTGAIDARRYAEAMDELNREFQEFNDGSTNTMNQFVARGRQFGKSFNRMSANIQQVGYQVSDFVVQVQGGTNAFVAFGQQGAQLFALIPGYGAILSIFAAIIGAVGAAWMRARDDMDEAGKSADKLNDQLKSLDDTLDRFEQEKAAKEVGLDLDEYISDTELRDAVAELEDVQKEVDRLTKQREAALAAGGSVFGLGIGRNDVGELEAAEQREKEAIERLERVRAKLEHERAEEAKEARKEVELASIAARQDSLAKMWEAEIEFMNAQIERERKAIEERRALEVQSIKDRNASSAAYWQEEITRMNEAIAKEKEAIEKNQELRFESGQAVADSMTEWTQQLEAADAAAKKIAKRIADAYNQGKDLDKLDIHTDMITAADAAGWLATRLGIAYDQAVLLVAEASRFGQNFGSMFPGLTNSEGNIALPPPVKPKSKKGGGDREDPLEKYMKRIELQRESLRLQEDEAAVLTALKTKRDEYTEAQIRGAIEATAALRREQETIQEQTDAWSYAQSTLESGFMAMIDGTKSVEDAFKDMARSIVNELFRVFVLQRLIGGFNPATGVGTGLLGKVGKLFGAADGAAIQGGKVMPFAQGGVVGGPTLFPMSGNTTGLMGEAGPEAIMPLSRNSKGDLGVAGPSITINNYSGAEVQVTRSDDELIEIAIQATKADYARSMATGQGSWAKALEGGYSSRRKAV